jgi:dTDP-4-dehydrorhamnose reductase
MTDVYLIFGKNGWIGGKLQELLKAQGMAFHLADSRTQNREAVLAEIEKYKPTHVLNAAGVTGRPNVDWCETHQEATWRSNVLGALTLADASREADAHMLHIGSGCVFYGPSPSPGGWREDDPANPISYYSRTKYAADLLLAPMAHTAVVRIRMPVDGAMNPRNLITKLAGYARVIDVENSVTFVDDLALMLGRWFRRRRP